MRILLNQVFGKLLWLRIQGAPTLALMMPRDTSFSETAVRCLMVDIFFGEDAFGGSLTFGADSCQSSFCEALPIDLETNGRPYDSESIDAR